MTFSETIKETGAADLLAGNACYDGILTGSCVRRPTQCRHYCGKAHFSAIRIIDQHGRQVPSGRRLTGSQVFDVAVGPSGNKIRFVPDTLNISVGDTVRWTWGSDDHSVTSGTPCTADGQFCSPIT